jgi:hypothetical protein
VTGRGRTCDAPRFKRALYLAELRSREEWAEPGSNRRPPPHQRGALPTELSAVDVACLSSPRRGARRTRGRRDTLRSSRIGTLAVSPKNLSMPLAYPSTLDRRPGAQRPTWRGVGARCSQSVTVSWQAKVTRTVTREIQRHIVEDLSLSSGASSTDRTFQAEHHLLVGSS